MIRRLILVILFFVLFTSCVTAQPEPTATTFPTNTLPPTTTSTPTPEPTATPIPDPYIIEDGRLMEWDEEQGAYEYADVPEGVGELASLEMLEDGRLVVIDLRGYRVLELSNGQWTDYIGEVGWMLAGENWRDILLKPEYLLPMSADRVTRMYMGDEPLPFGVIESMKNEAESFTGTVFSGIVVDYIRINDLPASELEGFDKTLRGNTGFLIWQIPLDPEIPEGDAMLVPIYIADTPGAFAYTYLAPSGNISQAERYTGRRGFQNLADIFYRGVSSGELVGQQIALSLVTWTTHDGFMGSASERTEWGQQLLGAIENDRLFTEFVREGWDIATFVPDRAYFPDWVSEYLP